MPLQSQIRLGKSVDINFSDEHHMHGETVINQILIEGGSLFKATQNDHVVWTLGVVQVTVLCVLMEIAFPNYISVHQCCSIMRYTKGLLQG